jgi:nucleoside-diphosphate-sugar epimerase
MGTGRPSKPLVLLTGGSGLIGARLAGALEPDFDVVILDVKPPPPGTGAAFVECDLTTDEGAANALGRVRREHGDEVASAIHLAAYYDFSGEPSPLYETLTVEGTRRLLRELKGFARVEQFVFSSTLLVMEPAEEADEVITETDPLEDEPWDYPRSKIAAEEVIRRERGDIPAVVLRMAGVYDEGCHSIPLGQHIARIYEKQLESYFFPGNPDHGAPYVHLDDLVACFTRAVQRRHELRGCRVYLVAEPEVMGHEALQDALGQLIHGKEWPTLRIPKLAAKAGAWVRDKLAGGDGAFIKPWMVDLADAHYPVAIKRAERELGWRPRHRLAEALPQMIRRLDEDPRGFYEENGLPLPDALQE